METLIGFAIGYVVGTQQGREGLQKVRDSLGAILKSDDFRNVLSMSAAVSGDAVKTILSGGAGPVLAEVVELASRKADELLGTSPDRQTS